MKIKREDFEWAISQCNSKVIEDRLHKLGIEIEDPGPEGRVVWEEPGRRLLSDGKLQQWVGPSASGRWENWGEFRSLAQEIQHKDEALRAIADRGCDHEVTKCSHCIARIALKEMLGEWSRG